MRSIEDITEELRGLADSADPEIAHSDADTLLIEALAVVWNQDQYASYQIENLVKAYAAVPKWYA